MNKQPQETCPADRLTIRDRCKVAAIALAFWVIFTGVFGVLLACGEPFADLKRYPLNPAGWFVVNSHDGSIVRDANLWDMVKAKYAVLLFIIGYVAVINFSAYTFLVGVVGRRNGLTEWVLDELSRESFRLSK